MAMPNSGRAISDPLAALHRLAASMGVATDYRDGLGRHVVVQPETLLAVCQSLGAELSEIKDADSAFRSQRNHRAGQLVAPTLVAWDGLFRPQDMPREQGMNVDLTLEDGTTLSMGQGGTGIGVDQPLPEGYHQLHVELGAESSTATIIASPRQSWHRPTSKRSWGVATHLAALRFRRSRTVGDLGDLRKVAGWVGEHGGDLVSVLPLLPTFNQEPGEPSPYSPVSRLFWSELVLDLGAEHQPTPPDGRLRLERADAEVRAALGRSQPSEQDGPSEELARYAQFRAAQKSLGRDWRRWPEAARQGAIAATLVDGDEERFHLVVQAEAQRQLVELRQNMDEFGVRLGLDLAVGVHPEGYDAWSRADLFADAMSVGAPPDGGFPSGQGWGFPPVLPHRSRLDGHAYFAASVSHQAAIASVLRIDHVMAMRRLYWIPDGMDIANGTYVDYPSDELFAVLCLESHRNECELIGENLGTVPPAMEEALLRHRIRGMQLVQYSARPTGGMEPPDANTVAMIGTHDTPTFAGWLDGLDVDERVELGLLSRLDADKEQTRRRTTVLSLADSLGGNPSDPEVLLSLVLEFLGLSPSPLVVIWLEDLWLETEPVNVPGSSSDQRTNWQRPLGLLLDDALQDSDVLRLLDAIDKSRRRQLPKDH